MGDERQRALRLLEGVSFNHGRLELHNRGEWHSIAAEIYHQNYPNNAETAAVCKNLGFE